LEFLGTFDSNFDVQSIRVCTFALMALG